MLRAKKRQDKDKGDKRTRLRSIGRGPIPRLEPRYKASEKKYNLFYVLIEEPKAQPPSRVSSGCIDLYWLCLWLDTLKNAEHVRPEATTVDALVNILIAQGHKDQSGAKHWGIMN